jgi:BolA family transcriptional regulator, general stress-responsive regulator
MGPVEQQLNERLLAALQPERLRLVNESGMHSVPKGSESHWNLIVVSDVFSGKPLVQRHRVVYDALGELMKQIHALTMKTLTPDEWEAAGGEVTNPAPPCRGGSKKG